MRLTIPSLPVFRVVNRKRRCTFKVQNLYFVRHANNNLREHSVVGKLVPLMCTRSSMSISYLVNLAKGNFEGAESMRKWTQLYEARPRGCKQFGKWEEFLYKSKVRVAFQPHRIFVGNFDPDVELNESYSLGRISDPGYQVDAFEKLNKFVPNAPESSVFLSQYYTNIPAEATTKWPALSDPVLLCNLPRFSPAVCGVLILQNHSGLVLDYVYENITKPEQLERDLELAAEVFERLSQNYGNDY